MIDQIIQYSINNGKTWIVALVNVSFSNRMLVSFYYCLHNLMLRGHLIKQNRRKRLKIWNIQSKISQPHKSRSSTSWNRKMNFINNAHKKPNNKWQNRKKWIMNKKIIIGQIWFSLISNKSLIFSENIIKLKNCHLILTTSNFSMIIFKILMLVACQKI